MKTPASQHKYGENGFKHKPRFGLIIEVSDEKAQAELFQKLVELGLNPRVVVV